jgi:hypothetical protein
MTTKKNQTIQAVYITGFGRNKKVSTFISPKDYFKE